MLSQVQAYLNGLRTLKARFLQIAQDVLALIPESKSKITFHPMPPDDPRVRCPDITRAKQILGWQPVVPRQEGMKKMIDFYRAQLVKK